MTPFPSTRRCIGAVCLAAMAGCGFLSPLRADSAAVAFPGSIRAVPTTSAAAVHEPRHAHVSRLALRSDENAALMTFEVALRMRNFDELQQRVAKGGTVSPAEKDTRYFPAKADHDAVVAWLKSQDLEVTRTDANRLAVFGRGTVQEVARAFGVTFARVATDDGEFTSAVTAPSLPANIAPAVVGVHGLQPHLRRRVLSLPRAETLSPDASSGYYPYQVAQAYNANTLSATGAGQTIAIYAFAFPLSSDLSLFWSNTGVSQSLSNIQTVTVAGGPAAPPSSGYSEEVSLDVEWASSMAPGADIRVYGASENDPADNDEILQQVYADSATIPSLHTLSICIGGSELEVEHDYLIIEAQYMANLASAGITVLSASGDSGAYAAGGNVLQVTYPTSDPDVTGVGGTTLALNSSGGVASETAWSNSGGGVSAVFSRPAWQTGTGVPAGTMRLVPDVAGPANPDYGAYYVYDGQPAGPIGGTSWATPVWAGFCALIDQTRAESSLPPIGLLNTTIYSLIGTSALRDIVSGSNGYYSAGVGYDLCTGVGVPVVSVLAQAALTPASAPIVAGQLGSRATVAGQPATFSVAAYGAGTVTYQWQRMPAGQSAWISLSDNGTYSGSATNTLVVSGTTLAMSGDEFQCVVANGNGTATSPAATLTVNTTGVTTFAGWPGAAGSANGTGWQARFSYPGGVRLNAAGNIFVADSSNYTVREITPAGSVTTIAGQAGVSGSTNGPATSSALFSGIGGVAPDTQGNVYVADSGNYTIREITSGGNVNTVAGLAGTSAHVDGTGSAARFTDPENLAFDPTSGDVYVADGEGNTIRKVTPAGVVTTLAGSGNAGSANGTGTAASFRDPSGIAVDSTGNVYVADTGNDIIRKITPGGAVTTLAGTAGRSGSTDGTNARFDAPAGVAADSLGNVYVADTGNDTIRVISLSGYATTLAGAAGDTEDIDGLPLDARFWTPGDLALDSFGNIYVADTDNMTIRRLVVETPVEPSVSASPQSQTIVAGGSVTLSVTATGTAPFTYQWYFNGAAIAGATSSTLALSEVGTEQAGSYTVVVTNAAGSVTSSAATLTVNYTARLLNLSARAYVGTGNNVLIAGFVVAGSGTKNMLIRADGPSMANNGVPSGYLPASILTLYDSNSIVIDTDTDWGSALVAGVSTVSVSAEMATAAFMNSLGAFSYAQGSADSAMEAAATPVGVYTAEVSGQGVTGVGLAELYDADSESAPTRLANISGRAYVGTGGNVLIGGFEVVGSTPETLLIRGVGPGLSAINIPSGTLPTPVLTLYDSNSDIIATNIGWGNAPTPGNSTVQAGIQLATSAVFTEVGAFSLPADSPDCAMIAVLPPGLYTVIVSGAGGTTGIGLVEIYEVP